MTRGSRPQDVGQLIRVRRRPHRPLRQPRSSSTWVNPPVERAGVERPAPTAEVEVVQGADQLVRARERRTVPGEPSQVIRAVRSRRPAGPRRPLTSTAPAAIISAPGPGPRQAPLHQDAPVASRQLEGLTRTGVGSSVQRRLQFIVGGRQHVVMIAQWQLLELAHLVERPVDLLGRPSPAAGRRTRSSRLARVRARRRVDVRRLLRGRLRLRPVPSSRRPAFAGRLLGRSSSPRSSWRRSSWRPHLAASLTGAR